MPDFSQLNVYSIVTLVDRTAKGGTEFIYDGIRFVFKPGEIEKSVPEFVAEWLFKSDQQRFWTKESAPGANDAQYVNRFAIKNCPEKLIELWGPEVADDSAIELDPNVIEGSDAPLYRVGPVRVEKINIPPAELRDRSGRSPMMATQAR